MSHALVAWRHHADTGYGGNVGYSVALRLRTMRAARPDSYPSKGQRDGAGLLKPVRYNGRVQELYCKRYIKDRNRVVHFFNNF